MDSWTAFQQYIGRYWKQLWEHKEDWQAYETAYLNNSKFINFSRWAYQQGKNLSQEFIGAIYKFGRFLAGGSRVFENIETKTGIDPRLILERPQLPGSYNMNERYRYSVVFDAWNPFLAQYKPIVQWVDSPNPLTVSEIILKATELVQPNLEKYSPNIEGSNPPQGRVRDIFIGRAFFRPGA